ncbi:MAG: hypothetical protein LIO93_05360, partial [Bacteroidales bacterium]|nr:hypothetical protein [Bacteroidales bacterium]
WVTEINLGVPHGITGILLLLLLIKEKNILNVDDQILKLAKLLLSFQRTDFDECSFPSKIVEGKEWMRSYISWCYGDLTTAYALLKTGILLDIKEYKELSLTILHKTIKREDYFHDSLVLCHGYVSNALIYNKIYELTQDKCFLNVTDNWKSLAKDLFEKQYNSFLERNEHNEFFEDSSLFYGFPGLFLAMMSWEKEIDLQWSNCLLL